MTMNMDAAIRIKAHVQNASAIQAFNRDLKGLDSASKLSTAALGHMNIAINRMARETGNTTAGLRAHVQALQSLRDRVEIGGKAYNRLGGEIDKLRGKLRSLDTEAKQQKGLSSLLSGARGAMGLAAAAGAGLAAKGIADAGLAAESAQVRLSALTDEFGEYNAAQAASQRIAKTLRITQTEAEEGFASLYAALRPTGVTVNELEKAFIGFTAAARNSGATAIESSAALVQLKQGLASGVLQGEELRSIREQAPLVAQAIAKEMGVSIGELKKLASEGKVTTDVVLGALDKLNGTQLGKLNKQFNTGQQALKDFRTALDGLGKRLAEIFGPASLAALKAFAGVLERTADLLGAKGGDGRMEDRIRAQQQAQKESQEKFGIGGVFRYGFQIDEFQNKRAAELYEKFQNERFKRDLKLDEATADQREAREEAAAERQQARERAVAEQREEAEKKRLQLIEKEADIRRETEEKLADAVERRAEQIADFREQTLERAKDMERSIADQRIQIERDIADSQARTDALREGIAVETERQRLRAAGLSTDAVDLAERVNDRFRKFYQERIQNERNAADRVVQLQRQLEEFKVETAQGIGQIEEGYAKSVRNILVDAGKKLGQLMEDGAKAAATALAGAMGGGGGAGGGVGTTPSAGAGSKQRALIQAANMLGVSPMDLATIISFETAGTFSPSIKGGAGGNYQGLIQFGPNERRAYGANGGQSFEEQITGPVVKYFKARFSGVGMQTQGADLLTLYRTVLGGNPKANIHSRDAFGTSPASGVALMQNGHRQKAAAFLSGAIGAPPAPMLPPPPRAASTTPTAVQGFDPAPIINRLKSAGGGLAATLGTDQAVRDMEAFSELLDGIYKDLGSVTAPLDDIGNSLTRERQNVEGVTELLRTGMKPEMADRVLQIQRAAIAEEDGLRVLESRLAGEAKNAKLTAEQRQDLEWALDAVRQRLAIQPQLTQQAVAEAKAYEDAKKKQQELVTQQQRLTQLKADVGRTLSDGIMASLEAAIDAAVNGAKNLKETLQGIASGVLKQIGSMLLRFGLNSLLGGAFGGGFFSFANGGVMTGKGAAPLKKYARGGIANSPQLAMFGEGSMPEAYVPLPDGRRIPVAMQAPRNDNSRMREAMGASPAAAAPPTLNMKFETTKINGVEYVSREQLELAMSQTRRQAARDGAKRGMSMTLDKLQQSPGTRSRVGIR